MNLKLISYLQKFFWFLGCALLVFAGISIAAETYFYMNSVTPDLVPRHGFQFLKESRLLFVSIGQAFFAFLLSSVFDMIFHRRVVRSQQTEKFLKLTCLGFVGDGVLGLIAWLMTAAAVFPNQSLVTGGDLLTIVSYSLSLFPHLISFVYAIAIYVLYRHFSQLVSFESEVV